jgi:hypothetical protein
MPPIYASRIPPFYYLELGFTAVNDWNVSLTMIWAFWLIQSQVARKYLTSTFRRLTWIVSAACVDSPSLTTFRALRSVRCGYVIRLVDSPQISYPRIPGTKSPSNSIGHLTYQRLLLCRARTNVEQVLCRLSSIITIALGVYPNREQTSFPLPQRLL